MQDQANHQSEDAGIAERILAFATHMGAGDTPAEETARKRGWIDEDGKPTDDGREMLEALGEQDGTRTVFRGNI